MDTGSPIDVHDEKVLDSDCDSNMSTYTEQLTKPEQLARKCERGRWVNWYIEVEDNINNILMRDDVPLHIRRTLEDILVDPIPVSCRKRTVP